MPPADANDSTLLNWVLFEMAVRLGHVDRSESDDAYVDLPVFVLVNDFFDDYDMDKALIRDGGL